MDIFQILREAKNPSGPKKTKRNNNLPDDLDVDDNDSPPEDATEGVDDGTSTLDGDQDVNDNQDNEQPEDTPEEDSNENTDESENNAALLRDSINLYYNIKQNIDKIDKLSYNNNLINKTNKNPQINETYETNVFSC